MPSINVSQSCVIERAIVDKAEMQFLYHDGTDYVFMNNSTYEQLHVSTSTLGDASNYVVDGSTAVMLMYNDEIIGVDLPAAVELNITGTEPGIQGDGFGTGGPGLPGQARQ